MEIYEQAAEPGEWCVAGAFCFLDDDESTLIAKRRAAFRGGFLGTESFGFTTLVQVAEADEDEVQQTIDRLAHYLLKHHGAPHLAAALPAAAAEVDDAAGACSYAPGTLLAVERELSEDGVVERLKAFSPNAGGHESLKLWSVEPTEES